MPDRSITIGHKGVVYSGEVMTIKSTTLGHEDHAILTAYLNCEGNGTGVSVGGYAIDGPGEDGREVSAYGLDHVVQLMRTVGVGTWEKLPGKSVIVLYASPGHWGQTAKGIANLTGDQVLIFEEHARQWRERNVPVSS